MPRNTRYIHIYFLHDFPFSVSLPFVGISKIILFLKGFYAKNIFCSYCWYLIWNLGSGMVKEIMSRHNLSFRLYHPMDLYVYIYSGILYILQAIYNFCITFYYQKVHEAKTGDWQSNLFIIFQNYLYFNYASISIISHFLIDCNLAITKYSWFSGTFFCSS